MIVNISSGKTYYNKFWEMSDSFEFPQKVDFVNIVPGCLLIDFSRVHKLSWKSSN